jgi:ABC-type multidrug transport system fused ATPase/permease subunit
MLDILRSLLLSFFAIAILLPVVRFALRRLSPARVDAPLTTDELKYIQKQEWKLTLAYFFFACVLSVFSAGILALASSILHNSTHTLHLLTPNFRALFAPALLIGITLAVIPLRLVQQSVLGHDYNMYSNYVLQVEGKNSIKGYRILFIVLLVLSAIISWYALRWHVTVNENQITVTNLLNEKHTYTMDQIEQIQYLGAEGEYIIEFDDASTINTTYLKPVQFEMIALLSARSGKRVQR